MRFPIDLKRKGRVSCIERERLYDAPPSARYQMQTCGSQGCGGGPGRLVHVLLCSCGDPSWQRPMESCRLSVDPNVLLPIREETPRSSSSLLRRRKKGGRYPTPRVVSSSHPLLFDPLPEKKLRLGIANPFHSSTLPPTRAHSKPIVAMGWFRRTKSGRGTSQPSSPGAGSERFSVIYGDDSRYDEEEGEFDVFYDACEVRKETRKRTSQKQKRGRKGAGRAKGRGES